MLSTIDKFPIRAEDKLLAYSISSLGKLSDTTGNPTKSEYIKTEDDLIELNGKSKIYKDIELNGKSKIYKDTQYKDTQYKDIQYKDIHYKKDLVDVSKTGTVSKFNPNRPFQQMLLSSIQLYSTTYRGQITPESIFGCNLVARKLRDIFNLDTHKFTRFEHISNDYLGIIEYELNKNRMLIAFDTDWTLAGINKYIQDGASWEMNRDQVLREKLAENQSVISEGRRIAGWESSPVLTGEKIDPNDLVIYRLQEDYFQSPSGCLPELYMIFAPILVDEAEKIQLYLYRDIQLYSFDKYLVKPDMSPAEIYDLRYIFPLEIDYLRDYVIIHSDQFTRDKLEQIIDAGEIPFEFPRLDDLVGAYATYLLCEANYYRFGMRWQNNVLYLKECGYIQALDLMEHFTDMLNDIVSTGIKFISLPNFVGAVKVSEDENVKCFYHEGRYYAAVLDSISEPDYFNISLDGDVPENVDLIELLGPLMAMNKETKIDPKEVSLYFERLGYDVSDELEEFEYDVNIGHRSFKIGDQISTVYYYRTSAGSEIDLLEIKGKNREDVKNKVQSAVRKGIFFTAKMKNYMWGYPGFIPSDSPRHLGLSMDPDKVLDQLK